MNIRRFVIGLGTALLGVTGLPGCSTCVADVVAIDLCNGGTSCTNSYCAVDAGVTACVPLKPLGAPCTRKAECIQLSCIEGTCVRNDIGQECP